MRHIYIHAHFILQRAIYSYIYRQRRIRSTENKRRRHPRRPLYAELQLFSLSSPVTLSPFRNGIRDTHDRCRHIIPSYTTYMPYSIFATLFLPSASLLFALHDVHIESSGTVAVTSSSLPRFRFAAERTISYPVNEGKFILTYGSRIYVRIKSESSSLMLYRNKSSLSSRPVTRPRPK